MAFTPFLSGPGPLWQQLYTALRAAVLAGELRSGERLPASRELARSLAVSRSTVVLAFEHLLAEGYVEARVGAGTFVAAELPERALRVPPGIAPRQAEPAAPCLSAYAARAVASGGLKRPGTGQPRWSFRYGAPALDRLPLAEWRRSLGRCARALSGLQLSYRPPAGEPELRQALAEYLRRSRGVRCEAAQVLVVNGSQQALDLVARVLVEPGDRVVIEEPSYQGARLAFVASGAELVPLPVDAEGLDVAALPGPARRCRLAYVTPSHQFPLGGTMPLARRLELLAWAERHDAFVVEDDYDSEYRYEGRPVESLQGLDRRRRVIYAGTFSKVLFPSLRLGYLVLPEPLVEPFLVVRQLVDRHTATLEQLALAELLSGGGFERHLRRSRTLYAARRTALLTALERCFGDRVEVGGARAGMHVVAWLRSVGRDEVEALVAAALAVGVGIESVARHYLGEPPAAGLLLGYAGLDETEIAAAVAALAGLGRI